jgi:TolB protein
MKENRRSGRYVNVRPPRIILSLLSAVVAILCVAPAAMATFPGEVNGRIAFSSYRDGTGGLWTMKPDGTDAKELVDGWAQSPAWAPHGEQIAFELGGRLGIVRLDGTGYTMLTDFASVGWVADPAWSPDGLKLVFSGSAPNGYGGADLFTIDVDGTHLQRITNTPTAYESSPDWSPDGKRIAFSDSEWSFPFYGNNIQTIDPDGGNRSNVTNGGYNNNPSWSPDGKRIALDRDGAIATIAADGTDFKDLGLNGNAPVYSPDGKQIAYGRYTPYPASTGAIATVVLADKSLTTLSAGANFDAEPDWQAVQDDYPAAGGTVDAPVTAPVTAPLLPAATPVKPPVDVAAALLRYLDEILSGARGPLVKIGLKGLAKPWKFQALVPAPGAFEVSLTGPGGAKASAAKVSVLAGGKATATKAGPLKITIKPTKAGKKILRKAKKLKVTLKVVYKPKGLQTATKSITLTLKRR